MANFDFGRMIFKILVWSLKNPIKMILALILTVLFIFGIVKGIKYLLKPSFWGFGSKEDSGVEFSSSKEKVSIFTLLGSLILILAIAITCYFSIRLHFHYKHTSESFRRISKNLNDIFSTANLRANDLHKALLSLNDSMLESYMDLLGQEGSLASEKYARGLEHAMQATKDLRRKANRFEPIIIEMRDLQLRLTADIIETKAESTGRIPGNLELVFDSIFAIQVELFEWIESLQIGATELSKYLYRSKEHLPQIDIESREIKRAIDQDIAKNLTRDGGTNMLPEFDLVAFGKAMELLKQKTSQAIDKASTRVDILTYQLGMFCLFTVISGIGALFVNRFRYPILGSISLFTFLVLIILMYTGQVTFNSIALKVEQNCASLSEYSTKDLKLIKIKDTAIITGRMVKDFITACQSQDNILKALQVAFGRTKHVFPEGSITFSDKVITIKAKDGQQLPIPVDSEKMGTFYATGHAKGLQQVLNGGDRLGRLLDDYRHNAELCADEGRLEFPKSWHIVQYHSPKLLEWIHRLATTLDGLVFLDGQENWIELLANIGLHIERIKGLAETVIYITERLLAACNSQLSAVEKLRISSQHLNVAQQFRLDAFERKAQSLLAPIFDSAFVINPAESCIKEACISSRERLDEIYLFNHYIMLALIMAAIATAFVAKLPSFLFQGLKGIFPCLELVF